MDWARSAPRAGASVLRDRLEHATAHLDPPFAVIDLDAYDRNTDALTRRAAGKPIRLATKSVRTRELIHHILARPDWFGAQAYSLTEAIWLHQSGIGRDILIGYPVTTRSGLITLAADEQLAADLTLMIDDVDQLDLIDAHIPPDQRPELRICLDLDASWRPLRRHRPHLGVRRSPLRDPAAVEALAAEITGRRGFRLVGLMSYEAQIAGLGDAPAGQPLQALAARAIRRWSYPDVLARRAAAVAAANRYADLEFVNGGGTGSVAATAADPAVTEITIGSGLFGPALFDDYRAWRPTPAAYFALSVVRRPGPGLVTAQGGGWVASGPAHRSRLPRPVLPEGLRLLGAEGAGEVQTPLTGRAADRLRVGDRVWFRHAKAGELCERVDLLHLLRGREIVNSVPTYRGENAPALL